MNRKKLKYSAPYIVMLMPTVILFVTFFIIPLIFTAVYSLHTWTNFLPDVVFIGLDNYTKVFQDSTVLLGIKNSLTYAVATVFLQNIIALPVSVVLNGKLKGKNFYRSVFFAPAVLSTLVVGYLWGYIMSSSDLGLLNLLLGKLNIEPVNWLGSPKIALISIIITQTWQWFGWAMVIYLGNLQSISHDYYEAAAIDGATGLQAFWHITVPQLSPAIKINIVTGMISGLKVFDIVFSLTKGGPGHTTETILTLMFSKFSEGNYGIAAAFGIIFLFISMILAGILLGVFKKWEDKIS